MLYSARRKLRIEIDDEATIGVKLDAYIPELGLAFYVIERETKEGITLKIIACRKERTDMCVAVKEAFQTVHIYIDSDNETDIQIARERFDLLKRRE